MEIFTIGHSNQPLEEFLGLLRSHGVTVLVDVRSVPHSRFARFRKNDLRMAAEGAGIAYRHLGGTLGGRPDDPALYGADGAPDAGRVRATAAYGEGLQEVLALAGRPGARVCLMCAEEDPARCHRASLLAPDLEAAGAAMIHIRRGAAAGGAPLQQEMPWRR